MEVLIAAVADQHRPEPRLPDTVALPQLESGALEALQQSRQTSDHTVINSQLRDHAALLLETKFVTLASRQRETQSLRIDSRDRGSAPREQ